MASNYNVDSKQAGNIEPLVETSASNLLSDCPQFTDYQEFLIDWATNAMETEILINKYGVVITAKDIYSLFPMTCVNDRVITFYMKLLAERSILRKNDGYPQVYGMDPMDFNFVKNVNHSPNLFAIEVEANANDVDIPSFDKILIPVHINQSHWCLTIIEVRDKTIKHYDSARWLANVHNMLPALNEYLKENYCKKYLATLDVSNWLTENVNEIPLQRNRYDCGVYTCMTAEFLCRNRPLHFKEDDMTYFRQRLILEIVTGKMVL